MTAPVRYTHKINLYRNIKGLGWTFQSYNTTGVAVKPHIRSLLKQQVEGVVRNIDVIKLDDASSVRGSMRNMHTKE